MDPNNNQPINTNPFGQPVAPQPVVSPSPIPIPEPLAQQPVPPVVPPAVPTPVSVPTPEAPRSNGKRLIALIVILLILILGMCSYLFFVKNQLNTAQKSSIESTSVVIPTIILPTATPATVDDINVASPDADLKTIEVDAQSL
jgi:hypothetical protein